MPQQLRIAPQDDNADTSKPPLPSAPVRPDSFARLGDIEVNATVELGRAELRLRDLARLGPGSIVRLDRLTGEPADLMINGRPFARGEIVVINDHLGLRLTELLPTGA